MHEVGKSTACLFLAIPYVAQAKGDGPDWKFSLSLLNSLRQSYKLP